MDLDVKPKGSAAGESANPAGSTESNKLDGSVGIDITKSAPDADQAKTKPAETDNDPEVAGMGDATTSTEISTTDDQPTQKAAATPEPAATEEPAGESKIDATRPVPPNNTINLAEHGTPLAQQVAKETEEQRAAREQERQKLAAQGLNPNVPNTDGIKGQAGIGSEINSDEASPSTMPAPSSAAEPNTPSNTSQEPPKKPGFFARLFGKK